MVWVLDFGYYSCGFVVWVARICRGSFMIFVIVMIFMFTLFFSFGFGNRIDFFWGRGCSLNFWVFLV